MIRTRTKRRTARIHTEMAAWMTDTALIRLWRSMRAEVERHKWIESEKAGQDIGWDRAWQEWQRLHGSRHSLEFAQAQEKNPHTNH